eukprot:4592547-Pyramimonas_sp.AAC.1
MLEPVLSLSGTLMCKIGKPMASYTSAAVSPVRSDLIRSARMLCKALCRTSVFSSDWLMPAA